jgi:hygromycin-B 7''-O-kinase
MILSLPSFTSYETFRTWRADTSLWLPAAIDIARSHGLSPMAPQVSRPAPISSLPWMKNWS